MQNHRTWLWVRLHDSHFPRTSTRRITFIDSFEFLVRTPGSQRAQPEIDLPSCSNWAYFEGPRNSVTYYIPLRSLLEPHCKGLQVNKFRNTLATTESCVAVRSLKLRYHKRGHTANNGASWCNAQSKFLQQPSNNAIRSSPTDFQGSL